MQAFIVRPFGIKQDIDFEKVERELIQPALKAVNVAGATTAKIVEAGNIREDMFSQLLLADLVIADLSIHNANVFYELGIRHALRDKKTFLIRSNKDEIPFDLKTDRYLSYDAANPAASIPSLIEGLKATLLSDRQDSPVFFMLPKLAAQDPDLFLVVPSDFGEEVEVAKAGKQLGKLALLAFEAQGFPWEMQALRSIGDVLYCLKNFEDALIIWEKVRTRYPLDLDANDRLATCYQRLAEREMTTNEANGLELLALSDLAVKRILDNYLKLDKNKRAEIYSLKARNAKTKWINSWRNSSKEDRAKNALHSPFLEEAYKDYLHGYTEDLNHFYSGINALGLLTTIISLAQSVPQEWSGEYDSDEEAANALKKYIDQQTKLITVVQISIDSEKMRMESEQKKDPWLSMTEADFACLTQSRPQRITSIYQKVIGEANDLNFDAAKRQLLIYEQLNVLPANISAALSAFAAVKENEVVKKQYYFLFTGHMIDKSDRAIPRFPPAKEAAVRAAIMEAVEKEKASISGSILGIAGGACGGDIIFHEVCGELGIPSELLLALPRELFVVNSVQRAGVAWVNRFNSLFTKLPKKVLSQTEEMPKWLQKKENYSIWERNNLWMLNNGLACGGMQLCLFALWDGKMGDGVGGTQHMVEEAQKRGAKTIIIDINKL
ncbi:MAG: tetratricopeptide repeat-containing protein [Chitinophagaceae bacterium]